MTNLEDLKRAWQSQSGISQERFDQIGAKVKDSTELLQSTILRRDMRETIACVPVVALLIVLLFVAKNWIESSGYAILMITCITVPIVLWQTRKRSIATVSAANFRDFLNIEIDYLRRQVRLLRRVAWWYLLPGFVGFALILIGLIGPPYSRDELDFLTVCLAVGAGIFIVIWWLNQNARKTQLEPLLQYYLDVRAALESGDESVTQMGDPPSEFLQPPPPRKPISRLRRSVWIVLTIFVTVLVVGGGYATIHSFDSRTGIFIASCAPVVACLMIFVSGIWRRDSV